MLYRIKGGRNRYEYVFTIGKMLIESWNMPGRGGVVGLAGEERGRASRVGDIYQPTPPTNHHYRQKVLHRAPISV